jgi:hypothetical protein
MTFTRSLLVAGIITAAAVAPYGATSSQSDLRSPASSTPSLAAPTIAAVVDDRVANQLCELETSPPPTGDEQDAQAPQDAAPDGGGVPDEAPLNVEWVTAAEASDSPKPDFYHVSQSKGCPSCVIADRLLVNPTLAGELAAFDCVLVVDSYAKPQWAKWMEFYGIRAVPTDVFVSADRKRWAKYEGVPDGETDAVKAVNYGVRVADALSSIAPPQKSVVTSRGPIKKLVEVLR